MSHSLTEAGNRATQALARRTTTENVPGPAFRLFRYTDIRYKYRASSALNTALVRFLTPIFQRMLEILFFTVPSAIVSASAISRLL